MKKILKYMFIFVISSLFLIPFAIMILSAFTEIRFMPGNPFFWLKSTFTLGNFASIMGDNQFLVWIKNSLIISIIPVFSQMFFAAILGYIFAKRDFFGKEFIFWMFMAVIMVPQQLVIIPKFIMFSKFKWINTYQALIVPELWGVMGVFLVRQYMKSIPDDLEEAAKIDGASDFTIFFKVILPLAMPVVATVGTFTFVSRWNDLFQPLIFLTEKSMYPITVGLASMLTMDGNFGVEMAGSAISFLPTFLIFLFFQRYFTEGIQMSGIK